MTFGALEGGADDWDGFIDGVAWFTRALSSEQIKQEYEAYGNYRSSGSVQDVPHHVVDAELIEKSNMPTVEGIAPYRSALVEYLYAVEKVLKGEMTQQQIIVQHWAIMDAVEYPVGRDVGSTYRLSIEAVSDHPELEGERVSSELIEAVDIYLDVGQ